MYRKFKIGIISTAIFLLVTNCTTTKVITINSADLDIKIDGNRNDWGNNISYQKDGNYGLGVFNDGKNLKLAFITSDRVTINKITRMGFTIWIDPENGSDKFGIKYPIQEMPNMSRLRKMDDLKNEDPSKRINNLLLGKQEFMIVNENSFPLYTYPISSTVGFHIKMNYNTGQLIYELNIPMDESTGTPIILDAAKGEEIVFTFQTNEIEREDLSRSPQMGGRQSGMGRGAGKGGMRGGGRRSGGRMGGMQNSDMMKQFEHSVIVKL